MSGTCRADAEVEVLRTGWRMLLAHPRAPTSSEPFDAAGDKPPPYRVRFVAA